MRQRNVWATGLAVALGLCAAGAALAEEPAGGDAGWWSRVFGRGNTAPAIRKEEKRDDKATPSASPAPPRVNAQADYFRRLECCDRLREIAFQTGDSDLMYQVDQLEQRVADAYAQRNNRATSIENPSAQNRPATKSERTPSLGSKKTKDSKASVEGQP